MSAPTLFHDGKVALYPGDNRDALKLLADASVDSVVCDPPYALVSIGKRFGADGAAPAQFGRDGAYQRASAGFMGKKWDTGETAFAVEFWAEVMRVLKPGGHLIAFGGTRTYHRMACAIEDAGFEIRDQLAWAYGSGFPKSHNVAKGITAKEFLGTARTTDIRKLSMGSDYVPSGRGRVNFDHGGGSAMNGSVELDGAVAACARDWIGWGTALKPAWEPIVLARKPLIGTVAENVLAFGTGAVNIDACRIEGADATEGRERHGGGNKWEGSNFADSRAPMPAGRWPANLLHDGSPEVIACFPDAPGQQANISTSAPSLKTSRVYGKMNREGEASAERRYTEQGGTNFAALPGQRRGDSGSSARFFYSAKADSDDRLNSKHPTVKPLDLMRWLVRLVTPKGGMVLDPFAGTGTTGHAALIEGCRAILCEREEEYQADIARRMSLVYSGAEERKGKLAKQAEDHGPLFGGAP